MPRDIVLLILTTNACIEVLVELGETALVMGMQERLEQLRDRECCRRPTTFVDSRGIRHD